MVNENKIELFYNAILKRSEENKKAFDLLMNEGLYSLVGSIIRLELDSLIRVCYINSLDSAKEKRDLIEQFLKGQRWQIEKRLVSDRKMVTHVVNNLGLGWAEHIYDIGCAFIHLSPYHDWGSLLPTENLTQKQREEIVKHVEWNQKIKIKLTFGFEELVQIAPGVLEKLRNTLQYELKR